MDSKVEELLENLTTLMKGYGEVDFIDITFDRNKKITAITIFMEENDGGQNTSILNSSDPTISLLSN